MFRTTHIRTKLAVALAVPMAALVAVAGFEVLDSKAEVDQAKDAGRAGRDVARPRRPRRPPAERAQPGSPSTSSGSATASTSAVANNPRTRGPDRPGGRGVPAPRRAATAPWCGTPSSRRGRPSRTSTDLRADIDAYDGPMDSTNQAFADEVFQRYTTIIEAFFDGTSQVVPDRRRRRRSATAPRSWTPPPARTRCWPASCAASCRPPSPVDLDDVVRLARRWPPSADRSQGFDDTIRANATGPYAGVSRTRPSPRPGVQSFNRQVEAYLAGDGVEINPLLERGRLRPDDGYTGPARTRPATCSTPRPTPRRPRPWPRMRIFARHRARRPRCWPSLVTWLASRSITRPLRSLRTQAEDMAGTRLPAAVRQILDTPAGRGRRDPRGRADHGEDPATRSPRWPPP